MCLIDYHYQNFLNELQKSISFDRVSFSYDAKNTVLNEASFDIQKGEKVAKQCSACHDFSVNLKVKIGPPLWGVVGRKAAAISEFKYSDALVNFKKDWNRETLFYFLENPKEYVKGTKMIYKGLKKNSDRVNLISYLESLK